MYAAGDSMVQYDIKFNPKKKVAITSRTKEDQKQIFPVFLWQIKYQQLGTVLDGWVISLEVIYVMMTTPLCQCCKLYAPANMWLAKLFLFLLEILEEVPVCF